MSLVQVDALEEVGLRQAVLVGRSVERLDVLHRHERCGGVLAELDGRLADRLPQDVYQTATNRT